MRTTALIIGGLLATSALSSPALAQTTPPPEFTNVDANGVDLTTGRVSYTLNEGGIGSGPGAIQFAHMFAQGAGWTDKWANGAYFLESGEFVVQLGGTSEIFTYSGGVFTSKKANGGTITVSGNTYTYQSAEGMRIDYVAPGTQLSNCVGMPADATLSCKVPTTVTQPNGLKFTLTWEQVTLCASGDNPCTLPLVHSRLVSISSSAGYTAAISFRSNSPGTGSYPQADWIKRSTITLNNTVTPASPAPTISYSSCYFDSCITDITNTGGLTWQVSTNGNPSLLYVRRPGAASNTITYTYGPFGASSVINAGVTTNYSRTATPTTTTWTATNALSQQTVVVSDKVVGRPKSVMTDGNTTSFLYDANRRLTRRTEPEGNYTQLTYDARGNVTETRRVAKSGSGLADIVTTASFDATCTNSVTCNQPNTTTDARGFITNYTYDPTHGGLLTLTAPAPTTGAVRPETRFTYSGVTSASGDVVQMLTKVSACQALSSCSNAADEVVSLATYNSQLQPTLVSSGSGNLSLTATTAMTYDPVGNLLTTDGPLAGTADTTRYRYNAASQIVGVVGPDPDGAGGLKNRATRYTYINGLLA